MAAPLAMPTAALAQQSEVEDSSTIDGFRLDQPAGPGNPVRTQPPVAQPTQTPPRTQPSIPVRTPAAQPQPTPRPATRPATPTTEPRTNAPAPTRPQEEPTARVEPEAETSANVGEAKASPDFADEATLPAVSETIPDDATADGAGAIVPADDTTEIAPETAAEPVAGWMAYWPYALGGLAALLFAAWLIRRRSAARDQGVEESENIAAPAQAKAPALALDLTEPVRAPLSQPTPPAPPPALERKGPPPGTISVSAAKLFGAPQPAPQQTPRPAPSAASQGFVTTRVPAAEPRPAAPSGTVGIPASRIALPEPPPTAIALVEGTKLAAQFAAPELIRDTDGLRLRFALGVGNIGNMVAKDVRIRTVLLTAAPDSDRAIAQWMANPNGPAAATIPHIDGGTQTNITGDIQLNADQIRAMSMQGNAIFVPMFAISIDFVGADGLDRFGEAYVIGLPPERASSNGAARVLPLPHDEKLPRRWTDLVHSRANIAA